MDSTGTQPNTATSLDADNEAEAPLTGEELVVAYTCFVDSLWAHGATHDLVARRYAEAFERLAPIIDDRDERAAQIEDTDTTRPSEWVFREDFITHLQSIGAYGVETALAMAS